MRTGDTRSKERGEKQYSSVLPVSLLGGVAQGRVDRLYPRRSSPEEGFTRGQPRCTNQFYNCLITRYWMQQATPYYLANRNWKVTRCAREQTRTASASASAQLQTLPASASTSASASAVQRPASGDTTRSAPALRLNWRHLETPERTGLKQLWDAWDLWDSGDVHTLDAKPTQSLTPSVQHWGLCSLQVFIIMCHKLLDNQK